MSTTKTDSDLFIHRKLSDDEVQRYENDGFLHLGPMLTAAGLKQMREEVMAAWEAEKGPYNPDATWLTNSLLGDVHHRSMLARRYYFRGPLVEIASQLVSPNLKGATSQLTFKMRGNTMQFAWHQDNGYGELDPYSTLTTLTALDDADEENGCLWIIPASHKQGQIESLTPQEKEANKSLDTPADESKAIPVPMKAGDAVCFHCWTLHKSEGNRSKTRDRRILFLRYADADAVEVYNDRKPRLGPLLLGESAYAEVRGYELELVEAVS